MKRERIEDLGILAERLKNICEMELFDLYHQRPKDFIEWFSNLTEEKKEDILHEIAYRVQNVSDELSECLHIAQGDNFYDDSKCSH